MPTINKLPKKPKPRHYSERGEQAYRLYSSQKWRKLREGHLIEHPLCEQCEKEGRVTLATEVHHIRPILSVDDPLMQQYLCYDPGNLMSVCHKCHVEIHKKLRSENK